jgi:AcrR family transcriptional regulator
LYKYFSSKDELYKLIITAEQQQIKERLNDAIRSVKTRAEKERIGLRAWLYYVRDNPGVYKLIWESLFIDQKEFDDYYLSFAQSYKSELRKSEQPLNTEDLLNLSYALVGISNFLGIRIIAQKIKLSDEEIEQMVETGYRLISKGIFSK